VAQTVQSGNQAQHVGLDKREGQPAGVPEWLLSVKLRLQFTGWLQYLPPILGALVFLLVAGAGRLIGVAQVVLFWIPLWLGGLFLTLAAFEVVAIKLGIRPDERVPRPLAGLDAFDLMRARRSCRSFQRRDLTPAHREAVLASARAHAVPAVLLGDGSIRFEYVAAPLTVWPVVGAHEFLVAIAPKAYDRTAIIDVGRSLQHVVLDATRLGIATCWIGPGADHAGIVGRLGERFDPAVDHIVCVCALGYRSRFVPTLVRLLTRSMHWRLPLASLFFADPELREPLAMTAPPFAAFGRCFEACQWSPSSYNGQTTRAVGVATARGVRMDFYAATGSHYYAPVALGIWCANWERGCEALGIPGHFAALDAEAPGAAAERDVLHYDLSWIAGSRVGQGVAEARA
jgi:nitroreductase